MECISNCPTEQIGNITAFNLDCYYGCYSVIKDTELEKKMAAKDERYILSSEEFLSCFSLWQIYKDADRMKSCFQQILPTLKQKYSIK